MNNANFEYHVPDSTTKYPYSVSSSVKWTRTSYGTTKSSGIIDTTSDDYPDYKKVHRGEGDDHKKVLMLANDVNSDGDGAAQRRTYHPYDGDDDHPASAKHRPIPVRPADRWQRPHHGGDGASEPHRCCPGRSPRP